MANLRAGLRCRSFQLEDELAVTFEHRFNGVTVKLTGEDGTRETQVLQSGWWSAHGYEEMMQGDRAAADRMHLVSQEELHLDLASKLLFAFMDGEPIVLMALGMSGSGKTFTLYGPDRRLKDGTKPWFDYQQPHVQWGLFPRIAHDIFLQAKSKGSQWICSIRYLQTCGNTVRDLIQDNVNFWSTGLQTDEDGPVYDWIPPTHISSFRDLCDIVREAGSNIRTDKTDFRDCSSLGHTILELEVERPHPKNHELKMRCKLLVCDLVGLEYEDLEQTVDPESSLGQLAAAGASIKGLLKVFQEVSGHEDGKVSPSTADNLFLERYLAPHVLSAKTFLLGTICPERKYADCSSNSLKFLTTASGVKTRSHRSTRYSQALKRSSSKRNTIFKTTTEEAELTQQMIALRAQVEKLGKERDSLQKSLREERRKSTTGLIVNGVAKRASELATMLGAFMEDDGEGDGIDSSSEEEAIPPDEIVDDQVLGKQLRFLEVEEEISAASAQAQEVESEFDELVRGAHSRLRARTEERLGYHEVERQSFMNMGCSDILLNSRLDRGAVHLWGVDKEWNWGRYIYVLHDKCTSIGPTGELIIEGQNACTIAISITAKENEPTSERVLQIELTVDEGAVHVNGKRLQKGNSVILFDTDTLKISSSMFILSSPNEADGEPRKLDPTSLQEIYSSVVNAESADESSRASPAPPFRRQRRSSLIAREYGMWASMAAESVEAQRREEEEIKRLVDSKRSVWGALLDAIWLRDESEDQVEIQEIRETRMIPSAWETVLPPQDKEEGEGQDAHIGWHIDPNVGRLPHEQNDKQIQTNQQEKDCILS